MEYKTHPDFPIRVYRDGRIWSLTRNRFLKCATHSKGYKVYHTKETSRYVHRLVMEMFGPEPPANMTVPVVDHIDEDKTNNHIDNLRWLSNKDNINHKLRRGEKHYRMKLDDKTVAKIRQAHSDGSSYRSLAEQYKVHYSTIWNLCNNVRRNKSPLKP